jgi:hypothetical protein
MQRSHHREEVCVGEHLDAVEVVRSGEVVLLERRKLHVDLHGAGLRIV